MQALIDFLSQSKFILLSIASIGLALCIMVEQSQLLLKYAGALQAKVAGGYNNAMKIMVLNRFGAVLYFFIIAIVIDVGMPASTIAIGFVVAIISVGLFDLVVFIRVASQESLIFAQLFATERSGFPILMAAVASVFGILGLTLPMLLSAQNPELRLTMANTGFLLNSIFTILTVFFVESYFANLIDRGSDREQIARFVAAVFLTRLASALIALAFMWFVTQNWEFFTVSNWL